MYVRMNTPIWPWRIANLGSGNSGSTAVAFTKDVCALP